MKSMRSYLIALTCLLIALLGIVSQSSARETVVHAFHGKPAKIPSTGRLAADASGNLFGTTIAVGGGGNGTVFELTPATGGGWLFHVLHVFGPNDGWQPYGTLVIDAAGNLYGITQGGGSGGCGTVFEMTRGAGGKWKEKVLTSFFRTDACTAAGGLALDAQGNLYGAMRENGGLVFELSPGSNGNWTYTDLYHFTASEGLPGTGPVVDAAGNVYGATSAEVYSLTPGSGGWTESIIRTFDQEIDGNDPQGSDMVFDASGNLYGTNGGGKRHGGTVYELSPSGNTWTSTVLHSFPENKHDGTNPAMAGVLLDSAGNIYGTTYTTIRALSTN
jgi:uncharacterized repeat protein (TIGR03803 family)